MNEPFPWRGAWYIKTTNEAGRRTQRKLGDTKDEAFKAWHRMLAVSAAAEPMAPVLGVLEAFLEWSARHHKPETYQWYLGYLGAFCASYGDIPTRDLIPNHVTLWVARQKYPSGAARAAIAAVKRALNWAAGEGLIRVNPLAHVRRPPLGHREQLVDQDMHQRMVATDRQRRRAFRLFLIALRHAGCRPGDVARVEARHFDEGNECWTFPPAEHKTGKRTRRARVVHLSPCLGTLSRILASARTTGPLFLNSRGKPWSKNAIRCRMRRLREKLGLPAGTVAYSYRHTWTTDALCAGVDVATVAELLGHGDTSMIDRHYGHLYQRRQHLQAAVRKAVGAG